MAELVDAPDLGSGPARGAGSTPARCTFDFLGGSPCTQIVTVERIAYSVEFVVGSSVTTTNLNQSYGPAAANATLWNGRIM